MSLTRSPRAIATIGMIVATGGIAISGATEPALASQQLLLETSCDGLAYTVTTAQGRWSVAQSVDHDVHVIIYAVEFAVHDADGNVIFAESDAKSGNAHQNQTGHVTCSFTGELPAPDGGTATLTGIAHGIQRP